MSTVRYLRFEGTNYLVGVYMRIAGELEVGLSYPDTGREVPRTGEESTQLL